MPNPHGFDYNQPSCDALAGIYVEGSDAGPGTPAAEVPASPKKPVGRAPVEQLFGITLSVDDEDSTKRPSRTPQA
jgi:hypothetical protein